MLEYQVFMRFFSIFINKINVIKSDKCDKMLYFFVSQSKVLWYNITTYIDLHDR